MLTIGLTFGMRPVMPEWSVAMMEMIVNLPVNTPFELALSKGVPVDEARNNIAQRALNTESKYLLFIDDDTAPPPHTARKLMQEMDSRPDAAVVGGIYFTRQECQQPVVGRESGQGPSWDWKVGDVFECAVLGTGCMLIRTEVFKHIEKPWFKTTDRVIGPDGIHLEGKTVTDDIYFLQKVKAAGFKIFADGGVIPFHWDVATGKHYTIPANSFPMQPRLQVVPEGVALPEKGLDLDQWKAKIDEIEAEQNETYKSDATGTH